MVWIMHDKHVLIFHSKGFSLYFSRNGMKYTEIDCGLDTDDPKFGSDTEHELCCCYMQLGFIWLTGGLA